MENGRVVTGDLPKIEKGKNGRVIMGDLPKWRNGLTVMGDLSKLKNMENGQVVMGDLPKNWMVRAQMRTQKEVGLENALPKW